MIRSASHVSSQIASTAVSVPSRKITVNRLKSAAPIASPAPIPIDVTFFFSSSWASSA